ncbi:hypothetical protein ACFE04_024929 [Oxalis oulophora]
MVNGLGFSPKNILLMKEFSLYTADEGVLPLWKGVVPAVVELWLSTWECLLPMIRVLASSRIPLPLEHKYQIGLILMVPLANHPDFGSRHWGDPFHLSTGDMITLGTTYNLSVCVSSEIESLIPFSIDLASDHMALRGGGRKLPMEDIIFLEVVASILLLLVSADGKRKFLQCANLGDSTCVINGVASVKCSGFGHHDTIWLQFGCCFGRVFLRSSSQFVFVPHAIAWASIVGLGGTALLASVAETISYSVFAAIFNVGWAATQERSRIMLWLVNLVEKHVQELAALKTWNNGKPYEQSLKSEVAFTGSTEKIDNINSKHKILMHLMPRSPAILIM